MTPVWGRKRCLRRRRPFSPPLCVQMPRPCLDSLQIPLLQPCPLHRTPRTGFFPRCVLPICGIKHRMCHCADKNYCTSETCTNTTSNMQSQNLLSPDGFKGDKDEDSTYNDACYQQKCRERNNVEDYEIFEPTCNEATCEEMETCGAGAISNDEELTNPFTCTPSDTNQSSLSKTPPIVPSCHENFNNDSARKINLINVSFPGKGMTPKPNKFDEVNNISNVNRGIQVNIQNETVFGNRRDAETSVAPKVCCSGNEVPNSLSLSGSSPGELYNVDKMRVPLQNIRSPFDAASEKNDTNLQSRSQPSKTTESHLNTHGSNIEDNGRYFRDNEISFTNENNKNPNNSALNPCCKDGFDFPVSEYKYQKQLNDSEKREFGDVYQRIRISPSTKPKPYGNASTSNELAKTSLAGNNSTSERRTFNEGKNQFMSSAPDDCCINGTTQGYLNYSESTTQKPPQIITSSAPNSQPIRSYTKHPLSNKSSQVRFPDNNYINNATFYSPIETHNRKYSELHRYSRMQINDNSSKNMNNKIQPKNSVFFDENGVICEDCKHGCCNYEPTPNVDCVCPNDDEYLTGTKRKHKNTRKLTTHDLKDFRCKKKPACIFEDGTTSCASMTCVVNQHMGCSCRYPPAFSQFSCTGNISGVCNCNDNE